MKSVNVKNSTVAGALALATLLAAGVMLAGPPDRGSGAARIAPLNSKAHGKSLAEWLSIYWRWYYSGADLAQSKVGNVQLLPLPADTQTGGNWTPGDPAILVGQVEITLAPGTAFVLPEMSWVYERYQGYPAVPDDPPMTDTAFLEGVHPVLTIDGETVISDANKAAFYVPATPFDPILVYPEPSSYGSVAGVSFQGIGIVSPPLPVGKHTITLQESFILPAGTYSGLPNGTGIVYEHTWIVTVSPR